jgi:hypothetical protein
LPNDVVAAWIPVPELAVGLGEPPPLVVVVVPEAAPPQAARVTAEAARSAASVGSFMMISPQGFMEEYGVGTPWRSISSL